MTKLHDKKKEKLFNYIDDQFVQLAHTNTFTKLNIARIVNDLLSNEIVTPEQLQEYSDSRDKLANDMKDIKKIVKIL